MTIGAFLTPVYFRTGLIGFFLLRSLRQAHTKIHEIGQIRSWNRGQSAA